jgi:esterase/lipase superfamily enzyme
MGELEQPSFWRLEFTEDPARHVVLASITPKREATFFRNLRRRIEKTEGREAFVFVHGYNVDFKDAACRAGQMAWDLNFNGVPILYSWPSQARVKDYAIDSTNAEWTIPHFGDFLSKLTLLSGARTIHLISHSMGNRPLLYALERFAHDRAIFNEIVLAAPDIDTEVFMTIAEGMRHTGKRITLYASSRDRALRLSKRFNGYPRAGDVTDRVAVVDGVETVDASAVNTNLLGHSYYGASRSVLSDIFYLLRGTAISGRAGIRQSVDKTYWIFQP